MKLSASSQVWLEQDSLKICKIRLKSLLPSERGRISLAHGIFHKAGSLLHEQGNLLPYVLC